MVFKTIVFVAILQVVTGLTIKNTLVNTGVGLIKGLRADDGDYSMFLGIPYGKVDETNPFGASTPYPRFKYIFEAFSDNIICPQVDKFKDTIAGTPDCLVLNVYVPNSVSSTNLLPVLVWIHGGGFINGDGSRYLYGPSFLVEQNIIVVAINYRLGPYGFMCLDTPKIPGNQGLKDQLLALRWINKHIEAFGGDANRITLSGQSAGSISVDLHLHSNNEKLFHQVILQSGTAMSSRVTNSLKMAPIIIANFLGFPTDSIDDAIDYLAKVDSHLVIAAVTALDLNFKPCIEKEFNGVESFLTQNWFTANLPNMNNMSILVGFTNDEAHWLHMFLKNEYYENVNIRDSLIEFDVDANEFKGMEDIVRNFYFGDEPMSIAVKRKIIDFHSDVIFVYPTHRSISKYLNFDVGNIFYYVFSYSGKRNFFKDFFNYTGATHSDELGYLFDISYMKDKPVTPEDEIIINRMTTMWANFVKFGTPIPQTSALLQIEWTPVNNVLQRPFLNIDSQLSLGGRPFHDRVTFWDLFYRANKNLHKSNNTILFHPKNKRYKYLKKS